MTYSIVARDRGTGELGVAVQSRSFRTGGAVPWATAGVGAVATQSFTERSYGPRLLGALTEGRDAASALGSLVAEDPLRDFRQVAVVSRTGTTAAHTGAACVPETGYVIGEGYAAQGNMLASPEVIPALAAAFEHATGTLADRLLAGLEAAELAGGDFRGREAGAILVVAHAGDDPLQRVSDVRVDNHPDPLGELRRLLSLEQALRRLRRAQPDDLDDELARAVDSDVDEEVALWIAATSLLEHDEADARRLAAPLVRRDPRWGAALDAAAAAIAVEDAR